MRPSRRLLAALLLALAVLASGCGGDAKERNAYVDAVKTAQRTYTARFDRVRKRLTATSTLPQDRATLGSFKTATASFVAALKGVTPPEVVREQHGRLIAAVAGYQRQVERAEERLASGSAEDRAKVRTELSSSVDATQTAIATAINDINTGLRE